MTPVYFILGGLPASQQQFLKEKWVGRDPNCPDSGLRARRWSLPYCPGPGGQVPRAAIAVRCLGTHPASSLLYCSTAELEARCRREMADDGKMAETTRESVSSDVDGTLAVVEEDRLQRNLVEEPEKRSTVGQLGVSAVAVANPYDGPSEKAIRQKLADLEGDKAALEIKIADLEGDKASLVAKSADLEKYKAALGEQRDDLEGQISALNTQIDEISGQRQNAGLETQLLELANQIIVVDGQIIDMGKQIFKISEQINALGKQEKEISNQMNTLYMQRTALEVEKGVFVSTIMVRKTLEDLFQGLGLFDTDNLPGDLAVSDLAQKPSPVIKPKPANWKSGGSKQSSVNSGPMTLSEFHIQRCDGTDSAFDVRVWKISKETIFDLIVKKLCNGDRDATKNLVNECAKAVEKLRDMFKWFEVNNRKIDELDHCQPAFKLLLNYIIQKLQSLNAGKLPEMEASFCRLRLGGRVQRLNREGIVYPAKLSGIPDLVVARRESHPTNPTLSWLFHVEVKSPTAVPSNGKHQLMGQSELIAQTKADRVEEAEIKEIEMEEVERMEFEIKDAEMNETEMKEVEMKEAKSKGVEMEEVEKREVVKTEIQNEETEIKEVKVNLGEIEEPVIKVVDIKEADICEGLIKEAAITEAHTPVWGCLTNFWKIVLSLRLPGDSGDEYDRKFFNTESVVPSEEYAVRLLFPFCEFIPGELKELTKDSLAKDPELMDSEERRSCAGENDSKAADDNTQAKLTPNSRKRPKTGNTSSHTNLNSMSLNDISDEVSENRWEQLRKISEWEARRDGCCYLCQENLESLPRKFVGLHGELLNHLE